MNTLYVDDLHLMVSTKKNVYIKIFLPKSEFDKA